MLKQTLVEIYFLPFNKKIFIYYENKKKRFSHIQVESCSVSHTNKDASNRFWNKVFTILIFQILIENKLDCSLDSDGSAS